MKRHLFLALSAALLFSLAACGSGDGETSQSQADTSQASEQSTQEEAVEISQGGTVNIPVASEPTTLLGWRMRNTTENLIASVMYETILRMGEDGEPYPYFSATSPKVVTEYLSNVYCAFEFPCPIIAIL